MTTIEAPPSLFDAATVGRVRHGDPVTSHTAAVSVCEQMRADIAAVLERCPKGLTDHEIAAHLFTDPVTAARRKPSVAKRRGELGCVDSGRRRPSPDGGDCIVWVRGAS